MRELLHTSLENNRLRRCCGPRKAPEEMQSNHEAFDLCLDQSSGSFLDFGDECGGPIVRGRVRFDRGTGHERIAFLFPDIRGIRAALSAAQATAVSRMIALRASLCQVRIRNPLAGAPLASLRSGERASSHASRAAKTSRADCRWPKAWAVSTPASLVRPASPSASNKTSQMLRARPFLQSQQIRVPTHPS